MMGNYREIIRTMTNRFIMLMLFDFKTERACKKHRRSQHNIGKNNIFKLFRNEMISDWILLGFVLKVESVKVPVIGINNLKK